ncbi:MAG: fibronectin type III domain-containing protein [Treponema sp.]|jgi:hypothetical protein|nr:fibronectin type III domain-containing protein [Treponema sp.]
MEFHRIKGLFLAVLIALAFWACSPVAAPSGPEDLWAELSGDNIILHCGYTAGAEEIEILCKSPSRSGFDFLDLRRAGNSSGAFTIFGSSLALFDGAAGTYAFQIRGRNISGPGDASSAVDIQWPRAGVQPPDNPPAVPSGTITAVSAWDYVYLGFDPVDLRALTSYLVYFDTSANPTTLWKECTLQYDAGDYYIRIPKNEFTLGSTYYFNVKAKNPHGESASSTDASVAVNAFTVTPGAPSANSNYVSIAYAYTPAGFPGPVSFDVLWGTSPSPTGALPQIGGRRTGPGAGVIEIPVNYLAVAPGTILYFQIRPHPGNETPVYSSDINVTLP